MRITAPLREAQFIESRMMNLLHYQTLVASKAIRAAIAAQGKRLVDFGLRRAHGAAADSFISYGGRYPYKYSVKGMWRDLERLTVYRLRTQLCLNGYAALRFAVGDRLRRLNAPPKNARSPPR